MPGLMMASQRSTDARAHARILLNNGRGTTTELWQSLLCTRQEPIASNAFARASPINSYIRIVIVIRTNKDARSKYGCEYVEDERNLKYNESQLRVANKQCRVVNVMRRHEVGNVQVRRAKGLANGDANLQLNAIICTTSSVMDKLNQQYSGGAKGTGERAVSRKSTVTLVRRVGRNRRGLCWHEQSSSLVD